MLFQTLIPLKSFKEKSFFNKLLENKTIEWQSPELEKRFDKVIINYGLSQGVFEITNLTNAVQFEVNNTPNTEQFQGHHPMTVRVLNNRLYIDLAVPTATKPIQFKSGKIINLPENWQWNSDSNTLEIVNSEVIPVFQEFYQYPNTFTIKGAIRSGDKVFAVDYYSKQVQILDFGFFLEGVAQPEKLAQYFAYPASEYPGVPFNK